MPVSTMKEVFQVYCIALGEDGSPNQQDKLIRLPPVTKPYGLRLKLPSGSEASLDGVLLTNYPVKIGEFNRAQFNPLSFVNDPSGESHCDLKVERAGIFEYRVEYGKKQVSAPGYFIVDPSLETKGNPLPLDSINLLSVVPKWLGPISQWKPHFEAAAKLAYNFVHFVPLQQRGGSNSPYSIFDQLQLSSDLFLKEEKDPYACLAQALDGIKRDQGLLGLIDMVWNHTASDSHWLWDHPEACYNIENSPHLRPAYELDTAIVELSRQLSDQPLGQIRDEQGIDAVMGIFRETTIPQLKLYEYYVIDVSAAVAAFRNASREGGFPEEVELCLPVHDIRNLSDAELGVRLGGEVVERHGVRFGKYIPLAKVFPLLRVRLGFRSVRGNLEEAASAYQKILDAVNMPFYAKYDDDVATILSNTTNHMRFQRLADNGPRYREVSAEVPLVQTYFKRLPANERTARHSPDALAIANNGWVWAADPKVDFASPRSSAYLRREVIVWGDCAKLRYGKAPEDNPWLWEHMRAYTEKMASLFDGFRIDNCHSTPVPLAAYLLDAARKVNPNLYVVAELFTGSEDTDKEYVCKLGINSLIREAMQAGDPHELSRLVHRYGGLPVGSLDKRWCTEAGIFLSSPCQLVPIRGAVTHSLFMDCTHDNETPTQKRTTIDALPNAALVGMSYCATGSVKGYDEAYPKLLELVSEKRQYQKLDDPLAVGLGRAKQLINNLHRQMCLEGYNEVHVHHEDQYIMVHRQNPQSHQGYLLIAHTAYKGSTGNSSIKPVVLRGTTAEVVGGYRLHVSSKASHADASDLRGLDVMLEELSNPELIPGSDHQGPWVEVGLNGFSRGSILVLKTTLNGVDTTLTSKIGAEANRAVAELSADDINVLLYRCQEEEQEMLGSDRGVYDVPGVGRLPYCGLQGFVSVLKPVMYSNDLGHALCDHLRQGRWALSYTIERLELLCPKYPALSSVVNYLKEQSALLGPLPPFLFPKYFSILIFSLYQAGVARALAQMNGFVRKGDEFIRGLAMCSVQLNGRTKTTGLHPTETRPCLAAGLPHFATRHMRCWGRDTFISLRGLFLCTGQYGEARAHILAYAGSLRHGLIPNLLDSLRSPRYNARDATWWFLQAVQDYCSIVPAGLAILQEQVPRRFPDGDSYIDSEKGFTSSSALCDIVQEILQRHAHGIHFREWNAGPNLDSHMQDEGFEVNILLDPNTGFLHGGNLKNCGTWMDKMGESIKAGSMGKPATPRDGAPVEITGLLKSTLRWLASLASDGHFPYHGVQTKDGQELKYSDWNARIQKSFEAHYFIPVDSDSPHVQADLVNQRGIYKDVVGSKIPFADYQLRPNFAVAMTVAPELFRPEHARLALAMADEVLVAPLGMKTLDPSDWNYRGDYDNANDSYDITIAKGFNYHQGPEWGWCLGYYLRAFMNFSPHPKGSHHLTHAIYKRLRGFNLNLKTSPFAGLPELTNANGKFCHDSCVNQAWSASTTLDTLFDLCEIHT